jgi:transglutaminase-like putative cysteine protease
LISVPKDQAIPIPQSTTKGTKAEKFSVNIISPRGAVVYSPGQLQSVSQPTQVQVAWHYYSDQVIDLTTANEANTPPLLWPMVQALQQATFSPPLDSNSATPTVTPEDTSTPQSETAVASPTATPTAILRLPSGQSASVKPGDLAQIQQTQSDLRRQHAITTTFSLTGDFKVKTLTFTGQLPVYSDVEAVFAQNGVGAGDTYDITSVVSNSTAQDLRTAGTDYPVEISSRYLQLPAVTDRVKALAEQLAAGKNNPYDIASTIETYLRTNMKYNENVGTPPKGEDAVDWFLFETKQGYCTFYASSMIEMLRVNNIPARLAVGFYPAKFDSGSGGFLYRDLNAHAWVEVYFPQYGWVPFEPTAARAEIDRQAPAAPTAGTTNVSSTDAGTTPQDLRERFLEENSPAGGGSGGVVAQKSSIGYFGWAVRAMIVVLLGLLGFVTYLWLRGLRGLSPTTQLFTKAQRSATWGGVPVRSSMTPYERASVIAERVPGSRQHVRYLADLYVRERYGGTAPDAQELGRARHAWLRLRSLMVRYLLVGRWRVRARRTTQPVDDD